MNYNYVVYKHTSPTGKCYIGITGQSVNKRWRNGDGYKTSIAFWRAIEKYGWNSFKHEILYENLSKESAESKEIELIRLYRSNQSKYGYNISNGGNSIGKHAEETKRKIGNAQRGEKSKSYKKYGILSPLSKPVIQFDIDGRFIKEWNAISDAYRELHISEISNCCNGIAKSSGGFVWRFKGDSFDKYSIQKDTTSKKICQYSKSGNLIKTWDSITQASISLIGSEDYTSTISKVCNGKLCTCKGYIWRYEKDPFNKYNHITCCQANEIIQLDKSGRYLSTWNSSAEIERELGINHSAISNCCKKKPNYNTAGGYKWMFLKDYIILYGEIDTTKTA